MFTPVDSMDAIASDRAWFCCPRASAKSSSLRPWSILKEVAMARSDHLSAGPDVSTWPRIFQEADLDYVPDPMVLRAAELFIGGRQYCRQIQKLDDSKVWPVIEKNIDGILAFFHVLMTRDRIPLIDYEYTFPTDFFRSLIGNIYR
jgi:hypothetical protein